METVCVVELTSIGVSVAKEISDDCDTSTCHCVAEPIASHEIEAVVLSASAFISATGIQLDSTSTLMLSTAAGGFSP